jgi:formylglycine-generating enzyme required for sulfatase activity
MHGNVKEWCQDWFGNYVGGVALDPQGPATGFAGPGIRGGAWRDSGRLCRSAHRSSYLLDRGNSEIGLRIVLAPGQP